MAFRSVAIANEAELHVRSGQLVVIQDQTAWIPTEDIAVLVLENRRITVSSAALSLLSEAGVAVVVCDEKHMPSGILLPHCQHSRMLSVTRQQFAATLPLKKRMWQQLVMAKIENQARCLESLGRDGASELREYAQRTASGDTGGMEAAAARYYFARLTPARRHSGEGHDGALDYGYAVLRAAVARSLTAHGFFAAVGIHHDSQLNSFNLADDFIEPFRPFADVLAVSHDVDIDTQAGRQTMLSVLTSPASVDGNQHSVITAIDALTMSLRRVLEMSDYRLMKLPLLADAWRAGDSLME